MRQPSAERTYGTSVASRRVERQPVERRAGAAAAELARASRRSCPRPAPASSNSASGPRRRRGTASAGAISMRADRDESAIVTAAGNTGTLPSTAGPISRWSIVPTWRAPQRAAERRHEHLSVAQRPGDLVGAGEQAAEATGEGAERCRRPGVRRSGPGARSRELRARATRTTASGAKRRLLTTISAGPCRGRRSSATDRRRPSAARRSARRRGRACRRGPSRRCPSPTANVPSPPATATAPSSPAT